MGISTGTYCYNRCPYFIHFYKNGSTMYHLKSIWAIKGKYMAVVKMVGSLFGSIRLFVL
jgi:hypothetical protein